MIRTLFHRTLPGALVLACACGVLDDPLTGELPAAAPGEVVVAAASSMSGPIREIVERFERDTGHTVRLSLGSSGSFFAQISNGAPFDVYLAADMEYPDRLREAGLIVPGSLRVYGTGRLVLWVPGDSPLDVARLGFLTLMDSRVRRVAIANPRLAPYGSAAIAAMESAGVFEDVSKKIIHAENVSQTAQFVSTGAVDVGVVALSLVSEMPEGRYWEIPFDAYPPIDQGVVILERARSADHYDAALSLVETLTGETGRTILERYGFAVPVS